VAVLLYVALSAGAVAFVAASAMRAVSYARTPIHLRWELYPVPHEAAGRAAHGGSYFEESEWWKKRRVKNHLGEWSFMLREMVFLKGLHEANRPLWYRSFPFHFGLYLLAASAALFLLAGAQIAWLAVAPDERSVRVTATLAGAAFAPGVVLAFFGAAALLHRRLVDPALRIYTTGADLFNLVFFMAALGLTAAGALLRPAGSPGFPQTAAGWLSWDPTLAISPLLAAGMMACALLLAYIPLTHMSHFIAKYFTYHSIRWDDTPLQDSGRMSTRLADCLTRKPTWSAEHLGADGSRTWADIATSNPVTEAKR
jgi:nitrate reductase gamma subunit